jgi:beta-lactamase superfamily II metal-dependent hydrolase
MFTIEMLPAAHGDCLWIEYGSSRDTYRMLIDTGTMHSYVNLKRRIEACLAKGRLRIEVLVISHIDADHIGGVLQLLHDAGRLGIEFGDIWFNGYRHLSVATDVLGAMQGERLTDILMTGAFAWNKVVDGDAIVVPDSGGLPEFELDGGMRVTVLSPGFDQLRKLEPKWRQEVERAGLRGGPALSNSDDEEFEDILGGLKIDVLAAEPFKPDTATPNGSSIALLLETDNKAAILGADAHASVLLDGLQRSNLGAKQKMSIDVFKLPHHGSNKNVNRQLIEAVPAGKYLVSTNGQQFRHPNAAALARVVKYGPRGLQLCFNYETSFNRDWRVLANEGSSFSVLYPNDQGREEGLLVDV